MAHLIAKVTSFELLGGHTLRVCFDDGVERRIDFLPVLGGKLFSPLRDPAFFAQVKLAPECHTLVWPNGADFDPAALHGWPKFVATLAARARSWKPAFDAAGHRRWLRQVWGAKAPKTDLGAWLTKERTERIP